MEFQNIKPVFIIGTGHSGTSILYKMLALHPDFGWFSQYSCRGGEIPGRLKWPLYNYFNRILRSFFKHNWLKKEGRTKIIPRPGEAGQIWDYVLPREGDVLPDEIADRLKRILNSESANWHKNRLLLKSIRFHHYLPILKKAFPQAKFIHIVRDGRAMALSRISYLRKAEEWKTAIEEINQEKGNLDFFELRYEDFCDDVRGHLKKILDFIGLDAAKFPIGKFPGVLTSKNSQWLQEANADKIRQIEDIQREMLKKYGYI
ncbi:MAG: sulfotransferase [bacterium]|nr:sulfotransferase [bacterium]